MKTGITYVPRDELLRIAKEAGCEEQEQAGFYKITKPGAKAIFYVAKTANCGRIDISNTTVTQRSHAGRDEAGAEHEIMDLGGESFGKVHQQVNFGRSADQIRETWRWLCENQATLEALPVKERQRPVALKGSQKKDNGGASEIKVSADKTPREQVEELLNKKFLLLKTADRMGKTINQETLDKLDERVTTISSSFSHDDAAAVEALKTKLQGEYDQYIASKAQAQ